MYIEQMKDFRHLQEAKIHFPFYMTANDYHDFKFMRDILDQFFSDEKNDSVVDYEELGFDGIYHAIFFLKSQQNDSLLKKEIEKIKKTFDS